MPALRNTVLLRDLMNRHATRHSCSFVTLPTSLQQLLWRQSCANLLNDTTIRAKIFNCVSEPHEMPLCHNNRLSESRETSELPLTVKDTKQNYVQLMIQSFLIQIIIIVINQITHRENLL